MYYTSEAIEKAVESFATLPSIGRKTAQRLVFFLLQQEESFVKTFAENIENLKKNVTCCSECNNYTEVDPCPICSSPKRERNIICVVEQPNDVFAIERTGEYKGLYHVLHGLLNPLENIGPEDIKLKGLLNRLINVEEVILALDPTVEGEATMLYIAKLLKPLNIKVTRLARGLPIGTDLEFADEATLSRALEGRLEI